MTPTEALSRLAAAGRIRSAWLPGMTWQATDGSGSGVVRGAGPGWTDFAAYVDVRPGVEVEPTESPATTGCLLALLREALGDPTICVVYDHDATHTPWAVGRWEDDGFAYRGPHSHTEHAAIVAALEAVAKECP